MQRRTCRVPLGLPVLHISSRWRLALFLHASLAESGTERERKRERERERERDAGAAGQDRDYRRRNRTGNWYPGHEASPSLCVERVTPPLLTRRVRSKHPRAVSGTVPSAPSFSTSSAAAQLLLLRPPSYPSRWMHTRRHGPPITKSMAAPDVYRLTFVAVAAARIKCLMICKRKGKGEVTISWLGVEFLNGIRFTIEDKI